MLPTRRIYNRFSSKNTQQKRTPTRKLITFRLGEDRAAIPIEKVLRVLDKFTPRAALKSGRSLVKEQEQIITLLDPSILLLSSQETRDCSYLIVCTLELKTKEKAVEYLGIPIPEVPKVLEVAEDKFGEVPEFYREGNLSPAVEQIINVSEDEVVFYLNLERFLTINN
jgi:chemotaxis signal transduction protein